MSTKQYGLAHFPILCLTICTTLVCSVAMVTVFPLKVINPFHIDTHTHITCVVKQLLAPSSKYMNKWRTRAQAVCLTKSIHLGFSNIHIKLKIGCSRRKKCHEKYIFYPVHHAFGEKCCSKS